MQPINVFISHCEEDTAQASALMRAVGEIGGRCFSYAFNRARPGTDWTRWLETALMQSHVVALLWSSDAARSKWIDREIAFAQQSGKPIVPVLLEPIDCPQRLPQIQAIRAYEDPAGWVMQFRATFQPMGMPALQRFAPSAPNAGGWVKKAAGLGLLGLLGAALLSQAEEANAGKSRRS